jgi:protease-4
MEKRTKYFGLGILGGFAIIAIIIVILSLIPIVSLITGPTAVAVIPVYGEIGYGASTANMTITHPDAFNALMDQANNDPAIGAIVLDINCGGGSPVASEEMLNKVNNSTKPVVAWLSDTGTSGAYMVATGADEIVASPSSWVGSIGVILTLSDLSDYYDKKGIDIYSITGGKYKDMGSDYRNLTSEERSMLQEMIDEQYDYFIDLVAKNRNLTKDHVKGIADGKLFTGKQAQNNSLVDKVGGKEEAIKIAANKSGLGETFQIITLSPEAGLLEGII